MIEIRHNKDTRSVYDVIYTGNAIDQMESYFIWLYRLLKLKRGSKLLDVSTGRGRMIEVARQRGCDAYGLDFSITACQISNVRSPKTTICGDGLALPFPSASFDAVTNIGSLEHFEDMSVGVREMFRILKPGGIGCVSVPNTFGLLWNVMAGWTTGDVDDDGQPLQRYGTKVQWQTLFTQNGFTIERVLGYEHEHAFPRTQMDLHSYWFHPKRILIMLLAKYIPVSAAGQFVFLLRK